MKVLFSLIVAFSLHWTAVHAQRQLMLFNGDRKIMRYKVGDTFKCKIRGDNQLHWGFIIQINEFSLITSRDTIELKEIDKVLVPGKPFINKVGRTLILIGVAYFTIDQFNYTVVHGNRPEMDPDVWKPAAVMVGAGVPLLFFQKKWRKPGRGKVRLFSVGRDSRFYLPDL